MATRHVTIVGDFTRHNPYLIVEYTFADNNFVSHKVLNSFKTYEIALKRFAELQPEMKQAPAPPDADNENGG